MKILTSRLLSILSILALLALFSVPPVGAAERAAERAAEQSTESNTRTGIGVAFFTGNLILATTAFSLWVELDESNTLQLIGGVERSSPLFSGGIAGSYKQTLSGTQRTGFHWGGSVGMGVTSSGTINSYTFAFQPLWGFHFSLAELSRVEVSPIQVSIDIGPTLQIADGSTNVAAAIGQLAVHYLF